MLKKHHEKIRGGVRSFIHFLTRLYISDVEVRGLRNLQRLQSGSSGAIFAGNHPSGLLDPMVVMTALPDKKISSVAKYGLFKAPVVGFFLQVMQSVPVAQPYDHDLPPEKQMPKEERQKMNEQMFKTVTQRLVDGVNVCIFPEGTCHSTPQIKALKVGTARMALQVSAGTNGEMRIPIFPVGITYSVPSGARFRAKVLVDIGHPVEVTDELLAMYQSGDPSAARLAEEKMTGRIDRHLSDVTVRVPDWVVELEKHCKVRGLAKPVYSTVRKGKKWYEQQGVALGKFVFGDQQMREGAVGVREDFQQYDSDKDGALTAAELSTMMGEKLGATVSIKQAEKMISDFSKNGEKTLSLLEFETMVGMERRKEQCRIEVGDAAFTSVPHYETVAEARRRMRKTQADSAMQSGAIAAAKIVPEKPSIELQRDAARNALFSLAKLQPTPSEWDFINLMHLSRRIYKPHSAKLTLGQYADLTRSFAKVAVRRIDDPVFQKLWKSVMGYNSKLGELGLTDKYVAQHARGSDPLNERLNKLREKARLTIATTFLKQMVGLAGGIAHSPIVILAQVAGTKMGVDEFGDRSVEATMRIVASLGGIVLYYPTVAIAVSAYSGSFLLGLSVIPAMALSGYTWIHQRPMQNAVKLLKGSLKLLTSKDTVDGLRLERSLLQSELRDFADAHAAPGVKGWWKNPEKYISKIKEKRVRETMEFLEGAQRVTQQGIEQAALVPLTIPLSNRFKRIENERAVLTLKQSQGNENVLLWIPGRNDSFFHVHILDRVLNAGFDLAVLDLRRCGRSKIDADGTTPLVEEFLAHDSYDFAEYHEEFDSALSFLKRPTPLSPTLDVAAGNGCGKYYENIVVYAHSTGGLVAAHYGADGSDNSGAWRGAIDGYIFNSPFWSWNLPWYNKLLLEKLENAMRADLVDPGTKMSVGGAPSEYSMDLYKTYGFPHPLLKSLKDLHVTAGWMNAVKSVQTQLYDGRLVLKKPSLVMSTPADEVLVNDDIEQLSQHLLWEENPDLFQYKQVGSSEAEPSAHDLLAAPSAIRVDEAMRHIEQFLNRHF